MADWKYDLEDLEDDRDGEGGDGAAEEGAAEEGAEEGGAEKGGAEKGAETPLRATGPIEPGTPRVENAAFVVLGAATAIFVFVQVLG